MNTTPTLVTEQYYRTTDGKKFSPDDEQAARDHQQFLTVMEKVHHVQAYDLSVDAVVLEILKHFTLTPKDLGL